MTADAPCPIAHAARRTPGAPAVRMPGGAVSFADLDAMANRILAGLRRTGIGPGDRIALALPPSVEHIALLRALWRRGATPCPLNLRLPEAARRAQAERIGARRTLGPDDLPALVATPAEAPAATIDPAARLVLFTSGSAGEPKAAQLGHAQFLANARAANARMPLAARSCWLLALPLYHVGGLGVLMRTALAGASVALLPKETPLAEAVHRHGVTHVSLVATQLVRILRDPGDAAALARLDGVLVGGGPVPAEAVRHAQRLGARLHLTYGCTEAASQVCTSPPGTRFDDHLHAGPPIVAGSVRIAADGEIQLIGPTLFDGYLGDGGALERPATPDGWYPTGDLGEWDAAGNLVVLGRADHLIISGGENIQPEEVEKALLGIDGIEEAVVVAVDDRTFGQRPVAFVRLAPGMALFSDAINAVLAYRLPRYKLPKVVLPWPDELAPPGMKPPRAAFAHRARAMAGPDRWPEG